MKGHTRGLLTVLLSSSCLVMFSATSFAIGLPDPLHYDMGALGQWDLSGGVSGFGAAWNNNVGGKDGSGDISLDNAMAILNKTDGQLQFTVWAGTPPNTPVMGLNSPNVGPSLNAQGSNRNPWGHASPLFKGYFTYQPVDWFSVQGGRLPSPDGTEIGVSWFNPTAFLSDLNNMQTTTADGGQVNFMHGPATLTVRLADGYKAGNVNELGFTGLYNLNADGSDYVVGFGHTRLSPAGNLNFAGYVAGFGTVNADLVGVGGAYVLGNWTISPELEYQWLPKDIVTGANAPQTTYYNIAGQVTFTYQINDRWSIGNQVQYITQHGDHADPNENVYGNFIGLNASGLGTIGPGSDMLGIQINPTWQYHNLFVRPAVAYTHLTHFEAGNGYGLTGNNADQFVGLVEVGFLFGQGS